MQKTALTKSVLTFVAAFIVGFIGYANYVTYTDDSTTFLLITQIVER
jgi:hypothetical protein